MDPNGNIHRLPLGWTTIEAKARMQKLLDQIGGEDKLEPIPAEQLPRVRKMNRKARRRWYAQQRKK